MAKLTRVIKYGLTIISCPISYQFTYFGGSVGSTYQYVGARTTSQRYCSRSLPRQSAKPYAWHNAEKCIDGLSESVIFSQLWGPIFCYTGMICLPLRNQYLCGVLFNRGKPQLYSFYVLAQRSYDKPLHKCQFLAISSFNFVILCRRHLF